MKKESVHFRLVYPSLTEEQLSSAIQGNLKVYDGDELLPLALNENDLLVFEQAKKDGYIKQKRTDKQGTWKRATRAYFFWCEIHNRTFVVIMEQSKFSDVRIELSTATGYGTRNIPSNVFDEIAELSKKYAYPWSSATIHKVPNSEIEFVVSQILKITSVNEISQ